MIIVKLMGGMGNQLFQYALGRALSLRHNTEFKMDLSFLHDHTSPKEPGFVHRNYDLDVFNVKEQFASAEEVARLKKRWFNNKKADLLLKGLLGIKPTYFREPHFQFTPAVFSLGKDVYLDGYWQTEKYFIAYEAIIREDLTFRKPLSAGSAAMQQTINNCEAVCVHVRRSDFVTNPMHGAMGTDYFSRGAGIIAEKIANPHFFLFSDDIEWCEANLTFPFPVTFVSNEYAGEKVSEYLQLMSSCRHFLLSNSSFSWWAAWLSRHTDKQVVAPKKWFAQGNNILDDLLPPGWQSL